MGGLRISQGGTLHEYGSDTTLDLTGLTKLNSVPIGTTITFSPAAAGTNVSEVTITVKDGSGTAVAGVHHLDIYLSDAATGAGLTGTTASGTVTAKAASGVVLSTYTAKKAIRVQTLATGVFVLEITDSAKSLFYVCAVSPLTGRVAVSAQLAAANYG